jgi:hypothetical protein
MVVGRLVLVRRRVAKIIGKNRVYAESQEYFTDNKI